MTTSQERERDLALYPDRLIAKGYLFCWDSSDPAGAYLPIRMDRAAAKYPHLIEGARVAATDAL